MSHAAASWPSMPSVLRLTAGRIHPAMPAAARAGFRYMLNGAVLAVRGPSLGGAPSTTVIVILVIQVPPAVVLNGACCVQFVARHSSASARQRCARRRLLCRRPHRPPPLHHRQTSHHLRYLRRPRRPHPTRRHARRAPFSSPLARISGGTPRATRCHCRRSAPSITSVQGQCAANKKCAIAAQLALLSPSLHSYRVESIASL